MQLLRFSTLEMPSADDGPGAWSRLRTVLIAGTGSVLLFSIYFLFWFFIIVIFDYWEKHEFAIRPESSYVFHRPPLRGEDALEFLWIANFCL